MSARERRSLIPRAVALATLLIGSAHAIPEEAGRDADLVARLLSALKADALSLRQMTWVETAVLEKRDPKGSVDSRTVEAEEIFFRDGRRMKRPLSADLADDSQSLGIVRREESRILQPGRARAVKANPFELENLIRCFRFEPRGSEDGNPGSTIAIAFTPVGDCFDDSSRAARILQRLEGTLWVDPGPAQIVRVEGEITAPVSFGFGILGRVDSFRIRVDRESVAPGVWAIVRADYRARGRSFIFNRFDVRSTRYRSAFAAVRPAVADGEDEASEAPSFALRGAESGDR